MADFYSFHSGFYLGKSSKTTVEEVISSSYDILFSYGIEPTKCLVSFNTNEYLLINYNNSLPVTTNLRGYLFHDSYTLNLFTLSGNLSSFTSSFISTLTDANINSSYYSSSNPVFISGNVRIIPQGGNNNNTIFNRYNEAYGTPTNIIPLIVVSTTANGNNLTRIVSIISTTSSFPVYITGTTQPSNIVILSNISGVEDSYYYGTLWSPNQNTRLDIVQNGYIVAYYTTVIINVNIPTTVNDIQSSIIDFISNEFGNVGNYNVFFNVIINNVKYPLISFVSKVDSTFTFFPSTLSQSYTNKIQVFNPKRNVIYVIEEFKTLQSQIFETTAIVEYYDNILIENPESDQPFLGTTPSCAIGIIACILFDDNIYFFRRLSSILWERIYLINNAILQDISRNNYYQYQEPSTLLIISSAVKFAEALRNKYIYQGMTNQLPGGNILRTKSFFTPIQLRNTNGYFSFDPSLPATAEFQKKPTDPDGIVIYSNEWKVNANIITNQIQVGCTFINFENGIETIYTYLFI